MPTSEPVRRSSWNVVSLMATTANLLALYGPMNGAATSPASDAVFTMWPSPWASSMGRNTRMPWMTPHRLTPSTHSQSAVVRSCISPPPPTPALLQTTWTAPNASIAASPERVDLVAVGHVGDHGDHLDATGAQVGGDGVERVGLDVGQHQPHALGREPLGQGHGRCRSPRR